MQAGDTTMKAGSLLDDNQWHDVEIKRNGREIDFTVDRLTITNMTNGEFFQLDLDRYVSRSVQKEKRTLISPPPRQRKRTTSLVSCGKVTRSDFGSKLPHFDTAIPLVT